MNSHSSFGRSCVIPAKAGIQLINRIPAKRYYVLVLSASQCVSYYWIPAFAGMTTQNYLD